MYIIKEIERVISNNIKRLLNEKGLSQAELARIAGVSESTVGKWVLEKASPRMGAIQKISDYFDIPKSYILEEPRDTQTPTVPFKTVPVLSKISAGLPLYAEQNIDDYTTIAGNFVKHSKEYFGLIVSGDSMDRHFKEGDIVIVEKDAVVENGQIAVVQVNGYNATLKRVKYINDSVVLVPESNNPEHDVQVYTSEDEVVFYGRVVGMTRTF